MQKRSAILFLFLCAGSYLFSDVAAFAQTEQSATLAKANTAEASLAKADSLYSLRQYTQAFSIYRSLYEKNEYSPAMLLRMAYIQEGSDHLGESLFYLNAYFLATDDHQALKKMEELAKKNNLEGYEETETSKIRMWIHEHYNQVALSITAVAVFLVALMFTLKVRTNVKPVFTTFILVLTLGALFVHINFSKRDSRGIVANANTYLMSGPSAGSSVIAIIGEGHQLEISGKKDVWLKVRWKEKDVWVNENLLRTVSL